MLRFYLQRYNQCVALLWPWLTNMSDFFYYFYFKKNLVCFFLVTLNLKHLIHTYHIWYMIYWYMSKMFLWLYRNLIYHCIHASMDGFWIATFLLVLGIFIFLQKKIKIFNSIWFDPLQFAIQFQFLKQW